MKLGNKNWIAFAGMLGLFAGQSAFGILALPQNLLVNPGFETGNWDGWTVSGDPNFEGVSRTFATTPYEGSYSAFFGAVGDYNIISQTIATTIGDTYDISFALFDLGGPSGEAYVDWGGKQVWSLPYTGSFGWTELSWTEVASSASTTIAFGFEQDPSYFNLDNTSVLDVTGNANPIIQTTVPDHGVGLWFSAGILFGLCAAAGCQRRLQTA